MSKTKTLKIEQQHKIVITMLIIKDLAKNPKISVDFFIPVQNKSINTTHKKNLKDSGTRIKVMPGFLTVDIADTD